MACHETPVGRERPCVGWLHNQLHGADANIALRMVVYKIPEWGDYETVGEQHASLAQTLPRTLRDGVSRPRRKGGRTNKA